MSLLPPQTINHDASSEGLIASVHVDVVKIAPKKTYSMGGHDYEGMDYHGLLVRVRTEDGGEAVSYTHLTLPTTPYV